MALVFAEAFSIPTVGASVAATLLGLYLIPGAGRKVLSMFRYKKDQRQGELKKLEDTLDQHGKALASVSADVGEIKGLLKGKTDAYGRKTEGLVEAVQRIDARGIANGNGSH